MKQFKKNKERIKISTERQIWELTPIGKFIDVEKPKKTKIHVFCPDPRFTDAHNAISRSAGDFVIPLQILGGAFHAEKKGYNNLYTDYIFTGIDSYKKHFGDNIDEIIATIHLWCREVGSFLEDHCIQDLENILCNSIDNIENHSGIKTTGRLLRVDKTGDIIPKIII